MAIFAFFLLLTYVAGALTEQYFTTSDLLSRVKVAFVALLVQMLAVGTALALVLNEAVSGNGLYWFVFAVGLLSMISLYVDLHKIMNRIDNLGGNPIL